MALALDGSGHANSPGGVSSLGVTLTTTSTNDDIILVATINGQTATGTVTDTAGLTWSLRKEQSSATPGNVIQTWRAVSSGVLTNDTITLSSHGAEILSFITLDAFGISGANTSTIFDSNASLPAGVQSGSAVVSTSNANDFIFGAYRTTNQIPAAGAGWTQISGADFQLVEYQIVSATQTNLTVTTDAGGDNGGIGDAIIAAGGFTAKNRRTLSQFGTGVGRRQIHGWNRGLILPKREPLIAHRSLVKRVA